MPWINKEMKKIAIKEQFTRILRQTRKATGFKSLRLKYWEFNQATPKHQIDFWTKLPKKV